MSSIQDHFAYFLLLFFVLWGETLLVAKSNPNLLLLIQTDSTYIEHKVIKGETLFSICRAYKVTPEEIRKLNRLTNNNIREGQKLKIKPINRPRKSFNPNVALKPLSRKGSSVTMTQEEKSKIKIIPFRVQQKK